jgi:hypothetical protein
MEKKKGIIKIEKRVPNDHNNHFGISFEGFSSGGGFKEGSYSGYETEEEMKKALELLIKNKQDYSIKIINELEKQKCLLF